MKPTGRVDGDPEKKKMSAPVSVWPGKKTKWEVFVTSKANPSSGSRSNIYSPPATGGTWTFGWLPGKSSCPGLPASAERWRGYVPLTVVLGGGLYASNTQPSNVHRLPSRITFPWRLTFLPQWIRPSYVGLCGYGYRFEIVAAFSVDENF